MRGIIAIVVAAYVVGAFLACAGSAQQRAEEQAADVCVATAGAEFALATKAGTAGAAADGSEVVTLTAPTLLCIWNALHIAAPPPTAVRLVDAGLPPG